MPNRYALDPRGFYRESRRLANGDYQYKCWNPETRMYEYTVLTAGTDVPEEVIIALAEMDDAERRSDRLYDDRFVSLDVVDDVPGISDEMSDPEYLFADDEKPVSLQISLLREAMDQLTSAQVDLIRDLFMLQLTQVAIAERDGVSKQAIQNRKNKIVNRLAKLILENGSST